MFSAKALNFIVVGSLLTGFLATPTGARAGDWQLHSFKGPPNDGAIPQAGLIDVNGDFYGTTASGGSGTCSGHFATSGCGTVYVVTPEGESVLYSFQNSTSDGAAPTAGLINVGGTLYGTTFRGGEYGGGTVFSITLAGVETPLHSFKGGSDGYYPAAGLINVGGTLYGTTSQGGGAGCGGLGRGTVFEVTNGSVEVLYPFKGGSDGYYPAAGLIEVDGNLYGTTAYGGDDTGCSCGTVFKINPAGTEKVLHAFTGGSDGAQPTGGLLNLGGKLFGTTSTGGDSSCGTGGGCGTVFMVDTSGGTTLLHSFHGGDNGDGATPMAGLTERYGTFYGTTAGGGEVDLGCSCVGTVFSITPWGYETVLYSFGPDSSNAHADGNYPYAGLLSVVGTLYGTTEEGGDFGLGTVFRITP
jgi:uncharacterized repeat protein (TIGR03803 family)